MKMKMVKRDTDLRCCARCEWVFWFELNQVCPKCGVGSYDALYIYGKLAYTFINTQAPWLEKKLNKYRQELLNEIKTPNQHQNKKRVSL